MAQVAKFVLLPLQPDKREEFMELLEANRQHTKEEAGTETWTLHTVRDEPDSVAMYELYADQAASDEHDESPALASILNRLEEFLAGEPTIVTMDVDKHRSDP